MRHDCLFNPVYTSFIIPIFMLFIDPKLILDWCMFCLNVYIFTHAPKVLKLGENVNS